jgi:hypothetical protein
MCNEHAGDTQRNWLHELNSSFHSSFLRCTKNEAVSQHAGGMSCKFNTLAFFSFSFSRRFRFFARVAAASAAEDGCRELSPSALTDPSSSSSSATRSSSPESATRSSGAKSSSRESPTCIVCRGVCAQSEEGLSEWLCRATCRITFEFNQPFRHRAYDSVQKDRYNIR